MARRPQDGSESQAGSAHPPPEEATGLDEATGAAIYEAAGVLVVVLDPDARILRFNPACEKATGYRAEQVVGDLVWRLVPEDERGETQAVFRKLRDGGSPSVHENDWLTRDGGRRRIAWSNAVARNAEGQVLRVVATGVDVTSQRALEARRRESELRLADVVHSTMDAIVAVDEAQRIRLFNPAAEAMFGYARDEVVGRPLDLLIPGRFREAHASHVRDFARAGATSRRMGQLGHVWGRRAGGEEFPVEASISRSETGGHVLLTVILRDVGERHRAAETAALLESIVGSSSDAILATDLEGRILSWNAAAERIYGYRPEEARDLRLSDLAPDTDRAQVEAAEILEAVRAGGTLDHLETRGRRRDGTVFDVSLGVAPRLDAGGEVLGASVLARDVTAHKALVRRLRQTEELASAGTLIAGVAHDIGTPMNVILGYLGMLERSVRDARDLERLRIVREQVERVVGLVRQLMNFARPHAEERTTLRVEEVLDHALDMIGETARRRGIVVERDYPGTPPIRGRRDRLERAFLNLLVNACDAMTGGGTLRVAAEPAPGGVRVHIADTGPGIASEALERIFEPFYTTKATGGGSGLGLVVTRGILAEQGGHIDVLSEVGKGTAFTLYLPLEAAPEPEGADAPEPGER